VACEDKRPDVSEEAKHRLMTLSLYVGIFLMLFYFFNLVMDANKKITYIDQNQLKIETISKATILEDGKNLMIETEDGKLYIVRDFDKKALEQKGISFSHENRTLDSVVKYVLSAALFGFVIMLSIT
jgi:hypothetical protein